MISENPYLVTIALHGDKVVSSLGKLYMCNSRPPYATMIDGAFFPIIPHYYCIPPLSPSYCAILAFVANMKPHCQAICNTKYIVIALARAAFYQLVSCIMLLIFAFDTISVIFTSYSGVQFIGAASRTIVPCECTR